MNDPPLTFAAVSSVASAARRGSGDAAGPSLWPNAAARCGHAACTRGRSFAGRDCDSSAASGASPGKRRRTVSSVSRSVSTQISTPRSARSADAHASHAETRRPSSDDSISGAAAESTLVANRERFDWRRARRRHADIVADASNETHASRCGEDATSDRRFLAESSGSSADDVSSSPGKFASFSSWNSRISSSIAASGRASARASSASTAIAFASSSTASATDRATSKSAATSPSCALRRAMDNASNARPTGSERSGRRSRADDARRPSAAAKKRAASGWSAKRRRRRESSETT